MMTQIQYASQLGHDAKISRRLRRFAVAFWLVAGFVIFITLKNFVYGFAISANISHYIFLIVFGIVGIALTAGIVWAAWILTSRPPTQSEDVHAGGRLRLITRVMMFINVGLIILSYILNDPLNPPSLNGYLVFQGILCLSNILYTALLAAVLIRILRPINQNGLCGQMWGLVVATAIENLGSRFLVVLPHFVDMHSGHGLAMSDLRLILNFLSFVFHVWMIVVYISAGLAVWRTAQCVNQSLQKAE